MAIAVFVCAVIMARGTRASLVTVSMQRGKPHHHVLAKARLPNGLGLVCDPVAGPYTTAMLKSVVDFREWPVEPTWTGQNYSLGRPAWGAA